MRNLVMCLGFNSENNGVIRPILVSRLEASIKLCRENPGSLLLLMGGNYYRNLSSNAPDHSLVMKKYIDEQAPDILATTEIKLVTSASTTVRELCFLREFLDEEKQDYRVTIVASEFFVDRVQLYSEYILNNPKDINFVAAKVPENEVQSFKEVEEIKYKKGIEWLSNHEKGDYRRILAEQEAFEQQVLKGEIEHPVSK